MVRDENRKERQENIMKQEHMSRVRNLDFIINAGEAREGF